MIKQNKKPLIDKKVKMNYKRIETDFLHSKHQFLAVFLYLFEQNPCRLQ